MAHLVGASGIFVDNTDSNSLRKPAGVRIGKDDDCAAGGDVQIVTRSSVSFASAADVCGSRIIAAGNIELTASANGLEGISVVAGGPSDVTPPRPLRMDQDTAVVLIPNSRTAACAE